MGENFSWICHILACLGTSFSFRILFQGCLYSKQPWNIEAMFSARAKGRISLEPWKIKMASPFRVKDRLTFHHKKFGFFEIRVSLPIIQATVNAGMTWYHPVELRALITGVKNVDTPNTTIPIINKILSL